MEQRKTDGMTKLLERSITVAVPANAENELDAGLLAAGRAVSLRFTLAPEDVADCAAKLERWAGVKPSEETWDAICLDTKDHAIAKLGLGFGVRRRQGVRRSSWRRFVVPLSSATPPKAKREVSVCLRHAAAIEVVARVETRRLFWVFACGGAEIEAQLDHSSAIVDGKTAVLASLTLACDAANAAFFRFVTEVCAPDRLRLSAESDLMRALRLDDGVIAPFTTAFPPKLDADMTAGEAFQAIAGACIEHFLLNEAAIRASDDREAVHQCRVALRRLSACLRLFSSFIAGADYESLRKDLKELGTYLRDARDLDVMIADVIAPALTKDPPAGASALMQAIEARRDKAHADLVTMLRAPSSAALLLRFVLWLEAGGWMRLTDAQQVKRRNTPFVKFAQRKFESISGKFAVRCAALAEMDREARHKTRIHAKNLRYDAEFFSNLAHGKTAAKRLAAFIDAVKKLQTVLGDWNDRLMAREFLSSFCEANSARLKVGGRQANGRRRSPEIIAANALAQRFEAMPETEFIEKMTKACASFGNVKPFWTKLN